MTGLCPHPHQNFLVMDRLSAYDTVSVLAITKTGTCLIIRETENSVFTIEFYRLFLTKSNGLC